MTAIDKLTYHPGVGRTWDLQGGGGGAGGDAKFYDRRPSVSLTVIY